jgi:hypothetical protein
MIAKIFSKEPLPDCEKRSLFVEYVQDGGRFSLALAIYMSCVTNPLVMVGSVGVGMLLATQLKDVNGLLDQPALVMQRSVISIVLFFCSIVYAPISAVVLGQRIGVACFDAQSRTALLKAVSY